MICTQNCQSYASFRPYVLHMMAGGNQSEVCAEELSKQNCLKLGASLVWYITYSAFYLKLKKIKAVLDIVNE